MYTAKDIMTKDVITVTPETEITHVAKIFMETGINGVPVLDNDENIIGIVCQSDLIAQQKDIPVPSLFTLLEGYFPLTSMKKLEKEVKKIAAITVADAMTEEPVTIEPGTPISEIAALMTSEKFHSLPVVEGRKVVGIVGMADILQTLTP